MKPYIEVRSGKPHLCYSNGVWWCSGYGVITFGKTVYLAHLHWQNKSFSMRNDRRRLDLTFPKQLLTGWIL